MPEKKSDDKVILNGVSGVIQPGEMACVMGTSGSGKTSLLNVLRQALMFHLTKCQPCNVITTIKPHSGRHISKGTLYGRVLVNGVLRTSKFRKLSAYVLGTCLAPR